MQKQQPMSRRTGINLIPNKHSVSKIKIWRPRTGTHAVAGVLGAQNQNIGSLIKWQDVARPTGTRRPIYLIPFLISNGRSGRIRGAGRELDSGRDAE